MILTFVGNLFARREHRDEMLGGICLAISLRINKLGKIWGFLLFDLYVSLKFRVNGFDFLAV